MTGLGCTIALKKIKSIVSLRIYYLLIMILSVKIKEFVVPSGPLVQP